LQESIMSEFKKVDGMFVPMKVVNFADGKKFMTMTQTEYQLLEKIDPKLMKIDN
jgi:glyoxylate utilization-related uncharacterized protein